VQEVLGPEPTTQRERLLWREAVEATALHHARYGNAMSMTNSPTERLLGARPDDPAAARSYDKAAASLNAAYDTLAERNVESGVDVAL
jgi:hypothetical protein